MTSSSLGLEKKMLFPSFRMISLSFFMTMSLKKISFFLFHLFTIINITVYVLFKNSRSQSNLENCLIRMTIQLSKRSDSLIVNSLSNLSITR